MKGKKTSVDEAMILNNQTYIDKNFIKKWKKS